MPLTVQNCEQEPIHRSGSIQHHGVLIAFNLQGTAVSMSSNAEALLGSSPGLGSPIAATHFDAPARAAITHALQHPDEAIAPVECRGNGGQVFDLVLHWSEGLLIAEWEGKSSAEPTAAHYATLVQRAIQQAQGLASASIDQLLQIATSTVRMLTGFDRVMAYRFLGDGSGTVVAESRRAEVPSYLHLRYPAGDIPEQARRLYIVNPIRQIADVGALPIAIHSAFAPDTDHPLDLSHSVLRSVSPIHIQYLKNMGVAASMSISIVIEGKLWGLIACHHMQPLCSSHSVRLSCTVLAQVLSMMIDRIALSQRAIAESQIENLRSQVASALAQAEDAAAGLLAANDALLGLVPSDGLSVVVGQRVSSFPQQLDRTAALRIADHLTEHRIDLFHTDSIARDLPQLDGLHGDQPKTAGVLAIQMSGETTITIIWWRTELLETIRWAGSKDKLIAAGPDGPRIMPRTSFEEWKETARGTGEAWSHIDKYAARELKAVLQEVALNQLRLLEQERDALLAILGHDLRDPLQAIDLAVTLLDRGRISSGDGAKRIEHSSRRMRSLIAYILDVSRLRSGLGLAMTIQQVALTPVLHEALEQTRLSFPGAEMQIELAELGETLLDKDRFVQALANLLSNARHHGDMRFPIQIRATRDGMRQRIEISNRLIEGQTFKPGLMSAQFKASSGGNPRNKTGLGLGLYIANAIIAGHGATLESKLAGNTVTFTILLNALTESETKAPM
jgi:light-regulated signal transduction histidine kinase (bacteriophytochrome)